MATDLRNTGIPIFGDVPWGTHFVLLCETRDDVLDALAPFFRAGLENNELCLWLFSQQFSEQEAVGRLRERIPGLDRHLSEQNIELQPIEQWYVRDGGFEIEQAILRWKERVDEAVTRGYTGLRGFGNPDQLLEEHHQSLAAFENQFEKWIRGKRLVVGCAYPLAPMSAIQVFDVAAAHQFVTARRRGVWQTLETPELMQAKAEIERLNEELGARVIERTQELDAVNHELRTEIANRQRTVEALRQSEERFSKAFHSSPTPIGIFRFSDGCMLDVNDAFARMVGYTRTELIGQTALGLGFWVNPAEREELIRMLSEGRAVRDQERLLRARSGRIFNVLVFMELIELEGETCVLVTDYDITERKRAEEEIKHQATRAETLARIAARLNKQLDLDAVVHAVCQEAVDTFKVSQATMSLYDKKRDQLVYAGGVNMPPEYAAAIEPITRTRFDEFLRAVGPIIVVPDIQAMPDVPNASFSSHLDVRTVVTAAMQRDQELIGVLVLGVNGRVREFARDELTLLKAISDQAAQAVANAQLLTAANEQHEQLRTLSAKLVEAQEAERRAIARELHDEVGQALTAAKLHLQSISQRTLGDSVRPLAETIGTIDKVLQQVRSLALDLRPSMLDDLGLVPALRWYIDRQAQLGGFIARFSPEAMKVPIPPDVQTASFRIAQEALTNVLKHAHAKHVFVELRQRTFAEGNGALELVVRDDGRGFDSIAAFENTARGESMGLLNMQERAQLLGGQFEIASSSKSGTEVRVALPLKGDSV